MVYFDLGGVFFDYTVPINQFIRRNHLNRQKAWDSFFLIDPPAFLGKVNSQEHLNRFFKQIDFSKKDPFDFCSHFVSHFQVIPETHRLAEKLSQKVKLGLLTNIYKYNYERIRKYHKIPLLDYSPIILSCDFGLSKPDPKLYELAQKKITYKPEEVLYVDDYPENIKVAKTIGWNTILFDIQTLDQTISNIEKLALSC